MGKVASIVVVVLAMIIVWICGLALLFLLMSGDGSKGHIPVLLVYLLGGIVITALGAVGAWKSAEVGGARVLLTTIGIAGAGALGIFMLMVACFILGGALNSR